ncbi:methylated-DNA--[protein]-cysteine S-methyltransferase [Candidatus Poribacteria bacterium]|nr:methylated-DNA--[protein]-cysteine S-methyltransferase [Candidatus Poribacteria bacterium]
MIYYTYSFDSIIGKIYLGATDSGLRFIRLGVNTGCHSERSEESAFIDSVEPFEKIIHDIKNYLQNKSKLNTKYKLDLLGYTSFQIKVWEILKSIPFGEIRSYKWVAEKLGSASFSRAVGQANGTNPLPLIIPCHRVIASDGSLGGFSCGIKYKKMLLEIEKKGVNFHGTNNR